MKKATGLALAAALLHLPASAASLSDDDIAIDVRTMSEVSPAPPGGSASAQPRVAWRKQLRCTAETGCKKETHLYATVNLVCDRPLPQVKASIAVKQGPVTIGQWTTVDCSSGATTASFDISDAKGFVPGTVTLTAGGLSTDGNYNVSSRSPGRIVRF